MKGKPNLGICYENEESYLEGYTDADFAGDVQTKRSTTGYIILFANSPIHWKSQRQKHVTLSSTEAEYVALCTTSKELIWLRRIGLELGIIGQDPISLKCDNQSAIKIAQSERITQRTRHLNAQEAYVRERIINGELKVQYVRANEQIADFLTKAISTEKFKQVRDALMTPIY